MMEDGMKKDGGPAFPTEHMDTGYESKPYMPSSGMLLRDWFAGMSLRGIELGAMSYEQAAKDAYKQADAMLEEREK